MKLLALATVLLMTSAVWAQVPRGSHDPVDTWVTVTGSAAGTDENAKDEAVAAALRKAVEEACGVFIKGQSKTEDFQATYDKVIAETAGYVLESKVLKVTRDEDADKTTVRVKARVSTEKFEEDWARIAHTIHQEGNPRVMVFIAEATHWTTDSGPAYEVQAHGNVQGKLEDFFLEKGLQLVDKDTADKVTKRDILLATIDDDVAAAAALGARFKADVVVIGQANAKFGRMIEIGGAHMVQYNCALNIRVVASDSARLLTSKTFTQSFNMTSRNSEDKALAKLGDATSKDVLASVVEAWRKRANVSKTIELQISGMDRRLWKKFQPEAAKIRGVQNLRLREITSGMATIDVEYKFNIDGLADKLEALKTVEMEITEQNANRLKIKVLK